MKSFLFIIAMGLAISTVYGISGTVTLDVAVRLYSTDKASAVRILNTLYQKDPAQFNIIKNQLKNREQYLLYRDFLLSLPAEKNVMAELVSMDLLTGEYNAALAHLQDYLIWGDPQEAGAQYAEYLLRPMIWEKFSTTVSNTSIRKTLQWAALSRKQPARFDKLLLSLELKGSVSAQEVSQYLLDSWTFGPRDVSQLLKQYSLEKQTSLEPLVLYSLFVEEKYQKVADWPVPVQMDAYATLQLDYYYMVSQAAFFLGDYTRSLSALDHLASPWRYDVENLRVLCLMGLDRYKDARNRLRLVKSRDDAEFYALLMDILEKRPGLDVRLAAYMDESTTARSHQLEVMLLSYTAIKDPEDVPAIAGLIKAHLLGKQPQPTSNVLASVYQGDQFSETVNDPVLAGFFRYRSAGDLILSGKKSEAEKILMAILEDTDTSPLVRSLAVYRLRNLKENQ